MTATLFETEPEIEVRIGGALAPSILLESVGAADAELLHHFCDRMEVEPLFTRQLVSFQTSKNEASYRWFKYKEAFSALLVQQLIQRDSATNGRLLDPFTGSGTALFAASEIGWDAHGIEVLPVGRQIFAARVLLEREFTPEDFAILRRWECEKPWRKTSLRLVLPALRITNGAYSPANCDAIERFMGAISGESERLQCVLRFALLCVLESVSFTRKDGQYLRWDARAGRRESSRPFNKGPILDFDTAISAKLREIVNDSPNAGRMPLLFPQEVTTKAGELMLWGDSCLDRLPQLPAESYDAIVTSPPYCNRYDYTRTYALELALLGVGERELIALRQEMLSCTVENRAKDLLAKNPRWQTALAAADACELLQSVLAYLDEQKAAGALNNVGIARMVRGYFVEMACVIQECARLLKPGASLWMVNDNVRYAGCAISVDLILSRLAEQLGFRVEAIHILPGSKGNSSQQMGAHGRAVLRKCVYHWRKTP